jgi:hypothetical protein
MRRQRRRRARAPSAPQANESGALSIGPLEVALTTMARSMATLAMHLVVGEAPRNDTKRIRFLSALGLDRNAVADLLGTTPQTVSTRLTEARRGPTPRRRRTRRA